MTHCYEVRPGTLGYQVCVIEGATPHLEHRSQDGKTWVAIDPAGFADLLAVEAEVRDSMWNSIERIEGAVAQGSIAEKRRGLPVSGDAIMRERIVPSAPDLWAMVSA